jgi:putative Holliday junction resolvase
LAKIIGLDIGGKRTGLAETDPLQIIASPLATIPTEQLLDYLTDYLSKEGPVELFVVGEPLSLAGGDSNNSARVRQWCTKLKKHFPAQKIVLQDERFSSKRASQALIHSGVKKKKRQQKGALDKISAALILEDYLQSRTS